MIDWLRPLRDNGPFMFGFTMNITLLLALSLLPKPLVANSENPTLPKTDIATPSLGENDSCVSGPFETDIERLKNAAPLQDITIAERKAANLRIPIEIEKIREGGYSLFVGSYINNGLITWYGFDVERRLFIAVLGHIGPLLDKVPSEEKLSDAQLLRYTDAAGYRRSEFVTVSDATPEQVREFSCLANELSATHRDPQPTFRRMTDTLKKEFVLIHNGNRLPSGGGDARRKSEGILEKFVAKPLQEPIMQTYRK